MGYFVTLENMENSPKSLTLIFVLPTDNFSHYIYNADMNQYCDKETQEKRDIQIKILITQSDSEFPSNYVGFDCVSVGFKNEYNWLESKEYSMLKRHLNGTWQLVRFRFATHNNQQF